MVSIAENEKPEAFENNCDSRGKQVLMDGFGTNMLPHIWMRMIFSLK